MIAMPKPWVWPSVLLLVLAGVTARAHDDGRSPHQLVLTSFAVEADSLHVVLWVERPTAVVAADFRARFADDRGAAAAQDETFRQEQWATLAGALTVTVDGSALDLPLRPLPLPNNGRGNDVKFVYGVGAKLPVGDRTILTVEYDNQALLDQPHVFLSVYAEADAPWRVREDSSRQVKGSAGRGPQPTATWSHDARLRQGRIVFARGDD